MTRGILILFFVIKFTLVVISAKRDDLSVILIPNDLKNNVNSVVRNSETKMEINGASSMTYTEHRIVTLLNDKAAGELRKIYYQNKFIKVVSFNVKVFNKEGDLLNEHGMKDLTEYAMFDGYSLYSDAKIKHIIVNGGVYPMTIEETITYKYKGLLSLPDWYFQNTNQSVEKASLVVEVTNNDIYAKDYGTGITPIIENSKHTKTYTWNVSDKQKTTYAQHSFGASYYLPHVYLSLNKFEVDGCNGSMESWLSFGKAIAKMWKGKRELSLSAQAEIKALVKNATTDEQKVKILYSYLQNNFRYVSIQVGIGGWIPFDANTVYSVKYGDCKALSNFMCAMLDVVGIEAHSVLINAGSDEHPIDTSFTSNYFNHAIACAKVDGHSLWLECTSNSLPVGELGTFTESRYGLLIGDSSGGVVSTPVSNPLLNQFIVTSAVTTNNLGSARMMCALQFTGQYRQYSKQIIINGTDKEKNDYLHDELSFRPIIETQFNDPKDSDGVISIGVNGKADNIYDYKAGNKLFLSSTLIKSWYENIMIDFFQKTEGMLVDFPFLKIENLTYYIDSTRKTSLPQDISLDNEVMSFDRKSVKKSDSEVYIATRLSLKKHLIPPSEILLFKETMQKINQSLQQKVIVE